MNVLEEIDYLDTSLVIIQSRFITRTALTSFFNDLWWEQNEGDISITVVLDLSAAFCLIDQGVQVLDRL